jgi:prephenate dehydrogenase
VTEPHAPPEIRTAVIVGSGLIGASVGMALRARGVDVVLRDRDADHAAQAADLGAGRIGTHAAPADVCVVAVPPGAVARTLAAVQAERLAAVYTDVASVKSRPQAEVETMGADAVSFVGGHPVAGRERSGPGAAQAELFSGRAWVLTPSVHSSAAATAVVARLVELCGAVPVVMDPQAHDRAMALISHAPHLVASAVAARLADAPMAEVGLAGTGIRDVTRIAASDPQLWVSILHGNARPVADVLDGVAADLARASAALRSLESTGDAEAGLAAVRELLEQGVAGRARIPGKHGAPPTTYDVVPVLVTDRPTQLAALFAAAGDLGVNIEDVSIEHSPGQPAGLVELSVRPGDADRLTGGLRAAGWTVHR